MNVNKRISIGKEVIQQLGLIPEGEEYDSDKHRINTITIYSDTVTTPQQLKETLIYRGYNQMADRVTIVVRCDAVLDLETMSGDKKLVRVHKDGISTDVDEVIRKKFHRDIYYIPLRNAYIDGLQK